MAHLDLPKSPNVFHPEKPSAVGSRNSLAQEFRDQQAEVDLLLHEEVDKVMNHINTKLPQEVLEKIDVMGGLKEKLYNYYNQNYQNMFNRFIVTTEDEMVKKIRNFVDKEEMKSLARYTPKEIAELLDQIGGLDKFNTGEIEKSIVNMYGHLQGHIQRGMNDLENLTNSILRQKTDVGAFIRGENAYSIIKCSFKDDQLKPKTVTNVKLSVNILDSELISPIYHYQIPVEYLIKELISKHIIDSIEKEIENWKDLLMDEGKEEPNEGDILFEKMGRVEKYTDDDKDDPKSKRYSVLAKRLMDRLEGLRAEIDLKEYDQLNIRENLKKIIDMENIRNRGFNTAVNSITSILDTSKMGYQYCENMKNARELCIREYEDTNIKNLPDERYQITLKYYDQDQLTRERDAYDKQAESFKNTFEECWELVDLEYQKTKSLFGGLKDYDDLKSRNKSRVDRKRAKADQPLIDELESDWDEITFIKPEDTDVEQFNRTYIFEKDYIKKKIILMREKLKNAFSFKNPIQRVVLEERINYLETEFGKYDYMINPYHVQPGIILDVDITSVKKKRATLEGMANVLNEFLHGVSKGFQDAAFASFSRRRSTMREDIAQSFGSQSEDDLNESGDSRLDFLNEPAESSAPAKQAKTSTKSTKGKSSKSKPKGIVDVTPPEGDGLTKI